VRLSVQAAAFGEGPSPSRRTDAPRLAKKLTHRDLHLPAVALAVKAALQPEVRAIVLADELEECSPEVIRHQASALPVVLPLRFLMRVVIVNRVRRSEGSGFRHRHCGL
jgi:hypothetical protein